MKSRDIPFVALDGVVPRHAEETSLFCILRSRAIVAPHYKLLHLLRLDNRVEAHVDGLRVAGDAGWEMLVEQLAYEEAGEVFAAAVIALESRDGARIERVLEVAERVPETVPGFVSALGWVEKPKLRGTVKAFIRASSPFVRRLGIAACAVHRVDPRAALDQAVGDPEPALRARALKAAGELGRADLIEAVRDRLGDEDAACRFWAAWSAVLLGDRRRAPALLLAAASDPGSPMHERALRLAPRLLTPDAARAWFRQLAEDPARLRPLIQAIGIHGDAHYVPWLIRQMQAPPVARPAGEAFSMLTGIDLAYEGLEGEWPEGFTAGPTENQEDEDVAMDPDEDLPWPAPVLIERWWGENAARFPAGQRFLCGRPVSDAHCLEVLRTGYQRQRIGAALELALLRPDRPLFEWRAPAFCQQAALKAGAGLGLV